MIASNICTNEERITLRVGPFKHEVEKGKHQRLDLNQSET